MCYRRWGDRLEGIHGTCPLVQGIPVRQYAGWHSKSPSEYWDADKPDSSARSTGQTILLVLVMLESGVRHHCLSKSLMCVIKFIVNDKHKASGNSGGLLFDG